MADAKETEISLKVVIERDTKKIVFAEANSDFVDILFSFLTLPMGTIVRLLANGSDPSHEKVNIGGFNNLYESVANLDAMYFRTKECQDMLLRTRNSAEVQCQNLKINIDDMKPIQYFICEYLCSKTWNSSNTHLSTCSSARCKNCPYLLNRAIHFDAMGEGVFVPKTSSFVISDDLHVIPNNLTSTLGILESRGIKDFATLEENTMKLGSSEILHLLERSFLSETPLSDICLGKKWISSQIPAIQSPIRTECSDGAKEIKVKVYVQKSINKILLAHCSEDFIDFLFSLLPVPLGKLISLLTKDHESLSIENIYQSVLELNVGEYLKSQQLKDMLLYPKLLSHYLCTNHIFPLEEADSNKFLKQSTSGGSYDYSLTLDSTQAHKNLIDQSPNLKLEGGFVRWPTKFMVTDDLVVTPFSSMSCFTYLHSLKVPPDDIEEQVIDIGIHEALHLLRASLTSTSVLSNGLKFFILKNLKQTGSKQAKV
ncbi:hypothetical protein POM88_029371 [Heracleum sosnowskyi]|uniref:DUF674 family protein n=1 Tax=Heracleum sosnowskyi TaxID=360622 RepID=A0AAD8HUL8_9APIA|nr:hypothetical protein POM88_029371 [Heracleum sosnowskyi]